MDNDKSTRLANKLFPVKEDYEIDILDIPAEKRKLNTENSLLIFCNLQAIMIKIVLFTIGAFLITESNAQISFTDDTWEPIGNTELTVRYDDIDNGDGINDGSIFVDGKDTIGPLGVLYTFQGTMELGASYHIETYTFKNTSSYVKYYIELYNFTDGVVLTSSPLITLLSADGPTEFVYTILDYIGLASDVGDILQLRYIRENTSASNHVARDFSIDNFSMNGSEIGPFEQVFAPKPVIDISAVAPSTTELAEMDDILAKMSDIMLGTAAPTVTELNDAVAEYDAQSIVVTGSDITGIAHTSKSDWAQADYLKTMALQLKFFPSDPTVYPNGLTLEEMCVNTIWLFSDQFYNNEIPWDYINYFYKLFAKPAVYLLPLLDTWQYNLFYYSLMRHSSDFVYYWSEEYVTGLAAPGAINEDDIYNISEVHLVFGLMQDTDEERLQWTKGFKRYYERYMSYSPGTADGIKSDGSSFHHYSALNNYSYCYNTPAVILPVLQGTSFQISEEAYLILRDGVYGQLILANDNVEALGMCGRHPSARGIAPSSTAIRALAIVGGQILGLGGPDPILAEAYVRHWGTHVDLPGIVAEEPNGFIQMNYHTGGTYWKDGWMVNTRGQTNWGFGAEITVTPTSPSGAENRNLFGRYQSYGTLEVIYEGGQAFGNGYLYNGWNWNYNPGATTIELPWDLLKAENDGSQKEFQENGFTGAIAFDNKDSEVLSKVTGNYGMFAMDFQESNDLVGTTSAFVFNHDSTFAFKKSVFFFGDYILSLGSNIENEDASHNTITTLFQRSSALFEDVLVDNTTYNAYASTNFSEGTSHWILDHYNTGYYVSAGSGNISLERRLEQNPYYHQYDLTLVSGNPSVDNTYAYLNHGTNPVNEGYEFVVIPSTTSTDMIAFASEMSTISTQPYLVIQKNESAHIAMDKAQKIYGLSLFSANTSLTSEQVVKANDTPCLIMYQELSPSNLLFTLTNPDLRFEYHSYDSSEVIPIEVTIRGLWEITAPHPDASVTETTDSTTTILFNSFDGLPIELQLQSSVLAIDEYSINSNVKVYPNPSVDNITYEISNSRNENLTLSIYSLTGQLITTIETSKNIVTINNEHIGRGLYLYHIQSTTDGKLIGQGKFIIQ